MIERISASASGSESGISLAKSWASRPLRLVAASDESGAFSSRWYIMIWQADS